MSQATRTRRSPVRHLAALTAIATSALAGAVTAGLATATTSASAAAAKSTTVLLVHGFDGGDILHGDLPLDSATKCTTPDVQAWKNGLRSRGWTDVRLVAWYRGDSGCDIGVPGRADNTIQTSITDIAKEFAWMVHDRFTVNGKNVVISAHSLGGLVTRAALAGVQNHQSGFPPAMLVSDVVTSGTPHAGSLLPSICPSGVITQCTQAKPGSAFLASLAHNPQGRALSGAVSATDWTLVGSNCDVIVSGTSALSMNQVSTARPAINRVRFLAPASLLGCLDGAAIGHGGLITKSGPLNTISAGLNTAS